MLASQVGCDRGARKSKTLGHDGSKSTSWIVIGTHHRLDFGNDCTSDDAFNLFKNRSNRNSDWFRSHQILKFDARVALFKGYNITGEQEYRDYKKFGTTSKIVDMGEVKEQSDPPK